MPVACGRSAGNTRSRRATLEWARGGFPQRPGNTVEVLIDGASFLPKLAEELARAESHVHLTGWNFSPELELTRGETPRSCGTCSPSSPTGSMCAY